MSALIPIKLSRPDPGGRHVAPAACPWVGPSFLESNQNSQSIWYLSSFEKGDPTQPIRHAKIKKFSKLLEFYQKFNRIPYVIWPGQGKTIYTHINQINPSMGYPNKRLAKIHSENKTQSIDFPTMSGHQNTYVQINNNITY